MPDYTRAVSDVWKPGLAARHPLPWPLPPSAADTPCSDSLWKWAHLPSWKSVYKMLFLLVPTLQDWSQLLVSVIPYNYQGSLWEQVGLLVPLHLFPIVQIKCDVGWDPQIKRPGEEKEKEGMKKSAYESLVASCAPSGSSEGSALWFWGEASRLKPLHVFPLIIWRCQSPVTETSMLSSILDCLVVKYEVRSDQVRPALNPASAPYRL